jgi:hypothetical protein
VGNQTADARMLERDRTFAVDAPMSTQGDDHTECIDQRQ